MRGAHSVGVRAPGARRGQRLLTTPTAAVCLLGRPGVPPCQFQEYQPRPRDIKKPPRTALFWTGVPGVLSFFPDVGSVTRHLSEK